MDLTRLRWRRRFRPLRPGPDPRRADRIRHRLERIADQDDQTEELLDALRAGSKKETP